MLISPFQVRHSALIGLQGHHLVLVVSLCSDVDGAFPFPSDPGSFAEGFLSGPGLGDGCPGWHAVCDPDIAADC